MIYTYNKKYKLDKNKLKNIINCCALQEYFLKFKNNKLKLLRLSIINKELCLEIGERQSKILIRLFISTCSKKCLYNLNGILFFYFKYEIIQQKRRLDTVCKYLLLCIYKNLLNNITLFKEAVRIINTSSLIQLRSQKNNNIKLNLIRDLKANLTLSTIKDVWSNIISVNILDSGSKEVIKAILKNKLGERYFFKIFFANKEWIINYIKIYNFLNNYINVPRIIDVKEKCLNNYSSSYWVLYEFIQAESIESQIMRNERIIEKISAEISKFSIVLSGKDLDSQVMGFLDNNSPLKYIEHKINDLDLADRRLNYYLKKFLSFDNVKGLCHGDLHLNQFICSDKKIYFVDLDMINYGYVIFDYASLLDSLFFSKRYDLIRNFAKYYKYNKDEGRFNREILHCTFILLSYFKYLKGWKGRKQLDNNISEIKKIFSICKI